MAGIVAAGVAGVVVGAVAGAGVLAVGIVASAALGIAALTQEKGETDIWNKAIDLLADVQSMVKQAENELQGFFDRVSDTVDKAVESVVNTAVIVGEAIDSGYNGAVSHLTDFLEWWDPMRIMYDGRYNAATTWAPRRDPLTLDLDGDGLETVGIDTGRIVYFDHNNDGVKTATGWVGSDDGFLALDRNGNGTIDSGAELFGDSTVLADGSTAADGFSALAEQDSNGDGVVDANDTGWGALRVWRDLNQNGISEAGELQSLEDIGIASLDVGAQSHSQVLADGNRLADLGRFTWATGELGEIESTTGQSGDIDLAENSFYRQFTDPVPLTTEAQALPEMHGSGALRNMREAASLSPDFAQRLTDYIQGVRMIISEPTDTTCPRHRLPDSAQSHLVHTLLKGIRSIRLFIDRHHSGQHSSCTCIWTPTRKNGVQRTGGCFMSFLSLNGHDSYSKTMGQAPLREALGGLSGRRLDAYQRPKEDDVFNFTLRSKSSVKMYHRGNTADICPYLKFNYY